MNITLSLTTERLIQERVERGEYRSAAELLDVAVQRLLATAESPAQLERHKDQGNPSGLVLEPLPSLKGSLPPNWKDDIY